MMEFKEDKFSWTSGTTWFRYFSAADKNEKTPLVVLHGGPGAAHNYAHLNEFLLVAGEGFEPSKAEPGDLQS